MKPAAFTYAAPTTLSEALDLLAEHADDDTRLLAGGQSLVPLMNFRLSQPDVVIDLRRVTEIARIDVDSDSVSIGAMVRMSQAEASDDVARVAPMMRQALRHVAHRSIRNSGTVGGSVAHADPAAELPAVMLALGAQILVTGPGGERAIPAGDFFVGPFTTSLSADEILTGVRITRRPGGQSFGEFARTHGSFALVGAGVDLSLSEGRVDRIAIALSGVGSTPVRAWVAEGILLGALPDDETVGRAATAASEEIRPAPDVHGSSQARREITHAYVQRGIEAALQACSAKEGQG
ncbi:MAG: xanthine dehydrogenase family protein subunit M [Actinomycetota bacterium]|nr:xanthine dehydrogenase family protein subunit M [Actinomycetota bacterium]